MHHTSEVFKYEASLQLDPDAFSSGGISLFISFFLCCLFSMVQALVALVGGMIFCASYMPFFG